MIISTSFCFFFLKISSHYLSELNFNLNFFEHLRSYILKLLRNSYLTFIIGTGVLQDFLIFSFTLLRENRACLYRVLLGRHLEGVSSALFHTQRVSLVSLENVICVFHTCVRVLKKRKVRWPAWKISCQQPPRAQRAHLSKQSSPSSLLSCKNRSDWKKFET